MEHPDKTNLRLARFAFGLAALASAGGALAQVTPAEPFGGRPFGADRTAAPPQQAPQPTVVQPGAAPVMVQPGGGPVVVQPQAQVQPPQVQVQSQPQPQVQPAPPTPAPNMAGPSGRQVSSVNAPSNGNGNGASSSPQQQQQATGSAAPPIVNPPPSAAAPAPVAPPFSANRAPAMGAAGAPAAAPAQQQPVRGLPSDAPRLVISGSVFSPDVHRRMLIVNGQVFREGADLGSGVTLQEVRPDSAVLDYKGGRYNVYF